MRSRFFLYLAAMGLLLVLSLVLRASASSLEERLVAAMAALWLASRVERAVQMAAASLVMNAAVCAMHYTGLAAASFTMMAEASTRPASVLGST